MAHAVVTRSTRTTSDDDKSVDKYDPCNDSDDGDDLRQCTVPERRNKRVVILLQLDCYEAQLWIKQKRPELENQDVPVVVLNYDKIILAVNYTAWLIGAKRGQGRRHLEDLQQMHPNLVVIETGELYGKQDSFKPQKISDDVFQVLLDYQKTFKDCKITMERSSKDKVYIDVTGLVRMRLKPAGSDKQVLRPPAPSTVNELTYAKKTHPNAQHNGQPCVIMEGQKSKIHGSTLNYRILEVYPKGLEAYHADESWLAHGAVIAFELVKLIKQRTGFDASAGVAHKKLLAKLACDRNKPQGITIFTDISFPRLSKTLEFKDIPGYGGKLGDDLRTYFAQKERNVSTLYHIITLPFDDLIEAFGSVGSKDKMSDAIALLSKCRGRDDSFVTKRHFTDTINASITFRGIHSVKTWNDFKDLVMNLSRDLSNRFKYNLDRWNRSPQSLVVKATMKKLSNVTPRGEADRMEIIHGLVEGTAMFNEFIMQYIKANNLEFGEIEVIKVTAGGLKLLLSADEFADITEAREHATLLAAENSHSGASKSEGKVKILSVEFNGSRRLNTSQELWREMKKFSEEIAGQIDHHIITQRQCPSELVVNVALFDDGGSEAPWTKENSLWVRMVELPDKDTIHDFILDHIDDNNVEARKIKAVQVTLKGIKKFGPEAPPFPKFLRTTKGYIRCPDYFPHSEEEY